MEYREMKEGRNKERQGEETETYKEIKKGNGNRGRKGPRENGR